MACTSHRARAGRFVPGCGALPTYAGRWLEGDWSQSDGGLQDSVQELLRALYWCGPGL